MPGRTIPLVKGEIYHVYNRGVARLPIFNNKRDYQRALESVIYYQNKIIPVRYSKFLVLAKADRVQILNDLAKEKNFWVDLICYCFMPNHFHFLLRQLKDGGISKFTGNFTNSYTRYVNVKNDRVGPLLQGKFKAVRIETDEQLLQVVRYILLNPYSSYLTKSLKDTLVYPYSAAIEYLNPDSGGICSKEIVMSIFKDIRAFRKFLSDQVDYRQRFQEIEHLTLEDL